MGSDDNISKRKGGGNKSDENEETAVLKKRSKTTMTTTNGSSSSSNISRSRRGQLEEIPSSVHYQVSFMHKATVTHVISSARYGYVITACEEGIVKFWKRTSTTAGQDSTNNNKGGGGGGGKEQSTTTPCLEFVKSFTAHIGPLVVLCIDESDDTIASIGKEDGLIKFYDVSTFDAKSMIKTTATKFGRAATFLKDSSQELLLAISHTSDGNISIYSVATLALVQTLSLHSKPVTALAYNSQHKCCISGDEMGILEIWDATQGATGEGHVVGAPCSLARNQIEYPSKMEIYIVWQRKRHILDVLVYQQNTLLFTELITRYVYSIFLPLRLKYDTMNV